METGSWVRFSPDGRWLATTGGGCRLWAVDSWQEGPYLGGTLLAFSPDSKLVAVETGHGVIRLVDPDTGREYARLEDPNQDRCGSLCFSSDGTQLVSTTPDSPSIHVWDLRAIREQLAAMDLDWELPPYPPANATKVTPPLRAVVDMSNRVAEEPKFAVAKYSLAIALQPINPAAYLRRGCVYYYLGRWREAVEDLSMAFALGLARADPLIWGRRAFAYSALNQWDKAIADYSKAIELPSANTVAFNNLAWLLATCPDVKFHDPARAVELAQKAVALAPKAGNSWNTLGIAHYRAGNWKASIEALTKSMELRKGGDGFDWFFLAMSHYQEGHKDEARKWYDQALQWMEKNQPKNEELKRFRAEAASLLGI